MELFELYNFVQEIADLFELSTDLTESLRLIWQRTFISLGVGAGLYVLLLLLGGFGIYTMAKRAGMKYPWMGFIPFANTYYLGKLAGEANFFGQKMKRAGLYAMLAEIAYFAMCLLSFVANLLLVPYYGIEQVEVYGEIHQYIGPVASNVPTALRWAFNGIANYWFMIVSDVLLIVFIMFSCVMYIAFFRKYFARNPIFMTVLCALFPVRGIVLFAVRNNTPVDYNEYMRRRMEEMARASYGYGPDGNGYGNGQGYNGGNGNGNGYQNGQGAGPAEDPFRDFGDGNHQDPPPPTSTSSGDDPFDDF